MGESVCEIVHGTYSPHSENHGRTVFRKDTLFNGLQVLIYFWDDRDGDELAGWWFAPSIGGDQVWAFAEGEGNKPPTSKWRVPHDGPVDAGLRVKVDPSKGPTVPKGTVEKKAKSRSRSPRAVELAKLAAKAGAGPKVADKKKKKAEEEEEEDDDSDDEDSDDDEEEEEEEEEESEDEKAEAKDKKEKKEKKEKEAEKDKK